MTTDHLTEEQLTLHYYGEAEATGVEAHLQACGRCRASYRTLQGVLNSVDSYAAPERPVDYGDSVWKALEHALPSAAAAGVFPSQRWMTSRPWLTAGAMAALLIAAFSAGILWNRPKPIAAPNVATQAAQSDAVRERVLLAAVGDHLERSQMVLIELANASPGSRRLDITDQQQRAQDLVEENRLYRQTAANVGDAASAAILEDLGRMLIEIAHSPSPVSAGELRDLRTRIEDQELLFRVKVFGSRVENDLSHPVEFGSATGSGKSQGSKSWRSKS